MSGANYVEINGKFVSAGYAKSHQRQPMVGLVRSEPQHREIQTLASRPPKQKGCKDSSVSCHVLIVRHGRKRLDDDNLIASYKALRDAFALYLGIDDADARIKFQYAQVTTMGATGTNIIITSQPRRNQD